MKIGDPACPDWIAHPDGVYIGAEERVLIDNRNRIEVIGVVTDAEANWSFDDYALVLLDGSYYLLNTSGCSCPLPEEEWRVVFGPSTLEEVHKHLLDVDKEAGYGVTARQHDEFMVMVYDAMVQDGRCIIHEDCREDDDMARSCLSSRVNKVKQ